MNDGPAKLLRANTLGFRNLTSPQGRLIEFQLSDNLI